MKRFSLGFSLVELLIVISIVAILAAVVFGSFSDSSAVSRDAQRKADLRNLQNAIELYYNENGRYPEACNGPTTDGNEAGDFLMLSGHSGIYSCPAGSEYIIGLAPKYIPTLPRDPKLNGADSGYVYAVNISGDSYKIMALDTVETESVDQYHDFFRCDSSFPLGFYFPATPANQILDPGLCVTSRTSCSGTIGSDRRTFNACNTPSEYNDTFGLSGGLSNDISDSNCGSGNVQSEDKSREFHTEIVRCQ